MSIGFVYWLVWLIWFIFWLASAWPLSNDLRPIGGNLLLMFLLFLLGWGVFGFPIHG